MYFCSKVLQSEDNRFDPYNILWVTSPSIKCHMDLSAMNYLLNILPSRILYCTSL